MTTRPAYIMRDGDSGGIGGKSEIQQFYHFVAGAENT